MLVFSNLAIRRGGRQLFSGINLSIHAQQKVGLTGANGTGKSSLFALMMGQLDADEGAFSMPPDWVTAHVKQETPQTSISALDYTLQGDREYSELQAQMEIATDEQLATLHARLDAIDGYTAPARAAILLQGLGFSDTTIQQPVSQFSGGWRMRLNLAQALMCRSDLLLLDEPTNHLDLDAVIWLQNWLAAYQGTLMLISHDREFLDGAVTHIASIEHEKITLYTGNYSAFENIRAQQLAQQQSAYMKQQREISHMQNFVDRFRAKATKAKQAQSRLKALERMQTIAPAHVDSPFTLSFFTPEVLPERLLMARQVRLGYGGTPVIEEFKLDLSPGDRLGLIGPNGAGKSTLIKYLSGDLAAMKEDVWRAKDLKIGYFAQHQLEQLDAGRSALEHLQAMDRKAAEQSLRNYLGGFGFTGERVSDVIAPFSGGEKARLALALIIYQKPNLLLLDEPTNHLDLEMRHALTVALQEFAGAMVIVSHDRHLLKTVTDRLVMVSHSRAEDYEGDLDDYAKWIQERKRVQEQVGKVPCTASSPADGAVTLLSRKERRREEAEKRRQLQPVRNTIKALEQKLDQLAEKKRLLQQQLGTVELYQESNKQRLKAALQEQQELDKALQKVEQQWLEATEALELAESTFATH